MLKEYFDDPTTLTRLYSGITGPHMDEFAVLLNSQGYSWWTVRKYVRVVSHFGFWLMQKGSSLETLNKIVISEFSKHLNSCHCPIPTGGLRQDSVAGANHYLNYLMRRGVVISVGDGCFQQKDHPLFIGFDRWMRMHRGVTKRTIEIYKPVVLDVLKILGDNPCDYRVENIRNFIIKRMKSKGIGQVKIIANALRMFLRYLVAEDQCLYTLVDAVPRIACWRLSSLPRYLPASEVERIIDACNSDNPLGCRDRAILLLLARLGLRGDDIAKMRLGDINWNEGSIRFSGKGRREDLLPLPQEVGDALLVYLQHGRPEVHYDHVFIRAVAPLQPLQSGTTVSRIVARALRRAGVSSPSNGAHVLRHSAATTMLNQGASLHDIAAILRHRSIETTGQYAKVHRSLLHQIVEPWPEV